MLHLDKIFSGKIRVRLLTRFLLNPESRVYLRGLEKEMGVSSNTVRLELNKLSEMKLIEAVDQTENTSTKTKRFKVNSRHPLFSSLRGIVMKYVGVEQIIEEIFDRLGNVEKVFLTGDLAQGKNSPFVDLVVVGDIDRQYMNKLIDKTEILIEKKIRIAVYTKESFSSKVLENVEKFELINLVGVKG